MKDYHNNSLHSAGKKKTQKLNSQTLIKCKRGRIRDITTHQNGKIWFGAIPAVSEWTMKMLLIRSESQAGLPRGSGISLKAKAS